MPEHLVFLDFFPKMTHNSGMSLWKIILLAFVILAVIKGLAFFVVFVLLLALFVPGLFLMSITSGVKSRVGKLGYYSLGFMLLVTGTICLVYILSQKLPLWLHQYQEFHEKMKHL